MDQLYTKLKTFGKVKANESMAKHTTFKIGGSAQFFVIIDSTEKLIKLFEYLDSEGVLYVVIGAGSNILVSDSEFVGVIVHVCNTKIIFDEEFVTVDAGVMMPKLAQEIVKAGCTGLEWCVGVPGTVGGSVRGNAGAMGSEIKDSLVKVDVYKNGDIVEYTLDECQFGYRDSIFKHDGGIILRTQFNLAKVSKDDKVLGMKQVIKHIQYRNKTQPQGYASTGCIFKNIIINEKIAINTLQKEKIRKNKELLLKNFDEKSDKVKQFLKIGKISVGWLVEQAGIKGEKEGNAQISPTHGNFIVNIGGATASEVQILIERVRTTVYNKTGFDLEEEIQLVG